MAMAPAALKSKMKATIYNGLKAAFSSETSKGSPYPEADLMLEKLAESISGIAMDIVDEITNNAQVLPGIPTAGGPVAQATVAPGKIA